MGEVIKLPRAKRPTQGPGNILCSRGFHRWAIVQGLPFDVRGGRLVTCYRCLRCGEQKIETR